jgi:hypothetical protein
MRKILAGFLVAIALGVPAVYFGVPLWAQHQAVRDVDAAFAGLQTSIGKASHGAVSYDVWTRTLKISDIVVQSNDPTPIVLKAAHLVATGLVSPMPGRFSTTRVDITNGELAGPQTGQPGTRTTYRAPQLTLEGFSGTTGMTRRPAMVESAAPTLALLDVFATMKATTVSMATLSATEEVTGRGASPVDSGFAGITLNDVADGRIGSAKIDHVTIAGNIPGLGSYAGELEKIEAAGVDTGVLAALIDPAQSKDDTYRQLYRSASMGPYRVSFSQIATLKFESLQLEDVAVRPSKFAEAGILELGDKLRGGGGALFVEPGARVNNEKFAAAYEGARVGKFELRGITGSMTSNAGGAIRLIRLAGMENGRISEFALEGVDARLPTGDPMKVGRLALQGIDVAKLMRVSTQFVPGRTPGPEQALALLPMIEGFDIKEVDYNKMPRQPLHIDSLALSWGQFVGPIPSRIRAAAKFSVGLDPTTTDASLKYLLDAGLTKATVAFDLGTSWSEAETTFGIAPLSAEISDLAYTSAKFTINNVPRALFVTGHGALAQAGAMLEAGKLELSLRDLGGNDLLLAHLAKEQGVTPDAARKTIADSLLNAAAFIPEMQTLGRAVGSFIETPRSSITVTLTPKGKVNLADAIDALRNNPADLLTQFAVETSFAQ